ncbi:MAG TPA: hypothetical protein VFI00_00735 [Kribbella sp.]|nr:hypothetical protein [Kribbella sp.]
MIWPDGVLGRALAAVYLIAFPVTYVGVVWILIRQWTGDEESMSGAALIVFAAGALTIVALSFVLRGRVPERANRLTKSMAGTQRAYHRLALGLELRGAWRMLTGRGASTSGEGSN